MNKGELVDLLKTNSFWAKKSMGQNFLVDDEALQKIVESADLKSDDLVVEIGPGFGILTEELLERTNEVIAIEKDEELGEFLSRKYNVESRKSEGKLTIISGDILTVNLPEIIGEGKYKVVANIPYYITSKIIRLFLESKNKPETMVMLVQKEVAERICGKPGDLSVLALSVQYFGDPEIIGVVPKESFFPSPKVDSAILKITINSQSPSNKAAEREFFRLVNIGFASKRKTLANNLAVGYKIDKIKATELLRVAGLEENARAQELNLEEWKALGCLVESL